MDAEVVYQKVWNGPEDSDDIVSHNTRSIQMSSIHDEYHLLHQAEGQLAATRFPRTGGGGYWELINPGDEVTHWANGEMKIKRKDGEVLWGRVS